MKRPNRKDYINKATKVQLIADQELYIEYLEAEIKKLRIGSVSKSLRDKEQFIELAKMIEIHIQKSVDYKASIGTGYFTERFNEVYKKYLESNVC